MWIFLACVGALVVVLAVAHYCFARYFYRSILTRRKERGGLMEAAGFDAETTSGSINSGDRNWLNAQEAQVLYLQSQDGLRLKGLLLEQPGKTERWAIVVHGYKSGGRYMSGYTRHFYEEGYGVLLPDCRGHGESEGGYIGMGWPDRLDLLCWIEQLQKKDPHAEIVLFGVSMGAASVLCTSGESLPKEVCAVVADCGYTSMYEELYCCSKNVLKGSYPSLIWAAGLYASKKMGFSFQEASALEQVKKSVTPTLLIHGTEDRFVPFWMQEKLYEAMHCEKRRMVVKGAGHTGAADQEPARYWDEVFSFLGKYVPDKK